MFDSCFVVGQIYSTLKRYLLLLLIVTLASPCAFVFFSLIHLMKSLVSLLAAGDWDTVCVPTPQTGTRPLSHLASSHFLQPFHNYQLDHVMLECNNV